MPLLTAAGERLADLRRMSRDDIVRAAGTDRFTRLPDQIPWSRPGADVVRVIEAAAVATGLRPRPKRVTRDRVVMAIGVSALVALVGLLVWSFLRSTRVEPAETESSAVATAEDAAKDIADGAGDALEKAADAADLEAPAARSA